MVAPAPDAGLSSWQALWQALGPAAVLTAYVLLGLALYAGLRATGWRWRDAETESRQATALLGPELRLGFAWILRPLGALLRASDVPAAALTTLSVALAAGAGVALATGRFALGGWLAIAGGLCDFFDGRLARARGEAGPWGAALDSVLDRYSDALLLGGLAWYWRETWVLLPALGALSGSLLVSYVRAKSETSGAPIAEGLMQRAERVTCIAATTALTPAFDLLTGEHTMHWLAVAGVTFVAVASQGTAARRFMALLKRLDPLEITAIRWPRWRLWGLATAVDLAVVVLLVTRLHHTPWLATAEGCVIGGLLDAALTRSVEGPQAGIRLGVALLVTVTLTAGGVALLQDVADWRLGWLLAHAVVLVAWTRTLERGAPRMPATRLTERTTRVALTLATCGLADAVLQAVLGAGAWP